MVVSNARDEEIRRFVDDLRRGGIGVEVCGTVYSAMARLARAADQIMVIVDIRRMDDHELRFVDLAPRYHRGVRVYAADLPGARRRMTRMSAALSLFSAADGARQQVEEPPPARPTPAVERAPARRTDEPTEPTMHEAVRQRMAGGSAAPMRRRPSSQSSDAPAAEGARLSEAEMAALLDERGAYDAPPHDGRQGRTDERPDSTFGARGD